MVPVFKNVEVRSTVKKYRLISAFFFFSRIFEKFVNNRLVDYLEKFNLFCNFSVLFQIFLIS